MKFVELEQFCEQCGPLKDKGIIAENEQGLLSLLSSFVAARQGIDKNTPINFSDFLTYLQNQPENQSRLSATAGLMETFFEFWLKESSDLHHTFMGTEIIEIPWKKLLFIEGRYASAEEILSSMQANAGSGKNIYLNPESERQELLTENTQNLLKRHPTCAEFIAEYESRQQEIATTPFPEEFYVELEKYLMQLYEIGNRNSPWCFPKNTELSCEIANTDFITKIKKLCAERWSILKEKLVEVSLRYSLTTASVKFDTIVRGLEPYGCVITQQIFLWSMLRQKDPTVFFAPKHLINSPQAEDFDLGPPRKITYSDTNLEASFAALRGKFGGASPAKKKTKVSLPSKAGRAAYSDRYLEGSFGGLAGIWATDRTKSSAATTKSAAAAGVALHKG
jgi:hypothetical protein